MSLSNIFPSKTIAIYMAKMFLVRTFAILFAVALVLQTLDVLSESGAVLAAPGNGQAQVWRYVSLRLPQIVSFLLPFSVLLGTILTFFTMNQNSEVIALKAAGMSAHQVLAPLLIASAGVAASASPSTTASCRAPAPRCPPGRRCNMARCPSTAATGPMSGCATATT